MSRLKSRHLSLLINALKHRFEIPSRHTVTHVGGVYNLCSSNVSVARAPESKMGETAPFSKVLRLSPFFLFLSVLILRNGASGHRSATTDNVFHQDFIPQLDVGGTPPSTPAIFVNEPMSNEGSGSLPNDSTTFVNTVPSVRSSLLLGRPKIHKTAQHTTSVVLQVSTTFSIRHLSHDSTFTRLHRMPLQSFKLNCC